MPDVDAAYRYLRAHGIDVAEPKIARYGMKQIVPARPGRVFVVLSVVGGIICAPRHCGAFTGKGSERWTFGSRIISFRE